MNLLSVYKKLLKQFGHQQWWPVRHDFVPPQLEICIGAILTQNTNWRNVEEALQNLSDAKATSTDAIAKMPLAKLEKLVRPSGFYKQKSKRLKEFGKFVSAFECNFYKDVTREQLLSIKGIGRETADSILLYACSRSFFVVDAYTRRLFSRLGIIKGGEDYDELRKMFEKKLPKDVELYKEFHALIVKHEKNSRKEKSSNKSEKPQNHSQYDY